MLACLLVAAKLVINNSGTTGHHTGYVPSVSEGRFRDLKELTVQEALPSSYVLDACGIGRL